MELIDLLGELHLDRVNDRTLQKAACGLAFDLLLDPLEKELRTNTVLDPAEKERLSVLLRESIIAALKTVVEGNMFTKIKAALNVKKKADRNTGLPAAELTDIEIQPLLDDADRMHIHHMSEEDYRILADHIIRIFLGSGSAAELFDWNTVYSDQAKYTLQTDAVNKVYTGLKTALHNQDFLIERAEESKQRAQRK